MSLYSCPPEILGEDQRLNLLIEWCKLQGLDALKSHGLAPHTFSSGVRGVKLTSTDIHSVAKPHSTINSTSVKNNPSPSDLELVPEILESPRPLLRVPFQLMMTCNLVMMYFPHIALLTRLSSWINTSLVTLQPEMSVSIGPLTEQQVLILFLIDQKRKLNDLTDQCLPPNQDGSSDISWYIKNLENPSFRNWLPYTAVLPREYDIPLFWSHQAKDLLCVSPAVCHKEYEELCFDEKICHHIVETVGASLNNVKTVLTAVFAHISSEITVSASGDASHHNHDVYESFIQALRQLGLGLTTPTILSTLLSTSLLREEVTLAEVQWAYAVIGTRSVYTPFIHSDGASLTSLSASLLSDVVEDIRKNSLDSLFSTSMSTTTPTSTSHSTLESAHHNISENSILLSKSALGSIYKFCFQNRHLKHIPNVRKSLTTLSDLQSAPSASAICFSASNISIETLLMTLMGIAKLSNSNDGMSSKYDIGQSDFQPTMALVPFFDLLNHSDKVKCSVDWIMTQNSKSLPALKSLPSYQLQLESGSIVSGPEDEAFISYGNLSNFLLLQRYGFCMDTNDHDSLGIDLHAIDLLMSRIAWKYQQSTSHTKRAENDHRSTIPIPIPIHVTERARPIRRAMIPSAVLEKRQGKANLKEKTTCSKGSDLIHPTSTSISSSTPTSSGLGLGPTQEVHLTDILSKRSEILTACGLSSLAQRPNHVFYLTKTGMAWDLLLFFASTVYCVAFKDKTTLSQQTFVNAFINDLIPSEEFKKILIVFWQEFIYLLIQSLISKQIPDIHSIIPNCSWETLASNQNSLINHIQIFLLGLKDTLQQVPAFSQSSKYQQYLIESNIKGRVSLLLQSIICLQNICIKE